MSTKTLEEMANEFGERMMLPGTQFRRFDTPHAFALELVGYLRSQGVKDVVAEEKYKPKTFHDPSPINIMPQVKIEQEILESLQRIEQHLGITVAHSQEVITLYLLSNIWAITDNDTIPKPNRLKAMNIILNEFAQKYPGFTPTYAAHKQIAKITQHLQS